MYTHTLINPVKCLPRKITELFRGLLSNGVNIIYPLKCPICKAGEPENKAPLCSDCRNKIKKNEPPFCIMCGKSLPAPTQESCRLCWKCQKENFYFQRAWNATLYEGVIRECIHLIKFKRKRSLIKPLSELLIDFSKSFLDISRFDLLVCVPLDRKKKWEREFNQASLLMQMLAKELVMPCSGNNLIKTRPTPAQSDLNRLQRFNNVKGVFRVRRPDEINNKSILLIDDVFTTGATSSECAKTLKNNGARHIEVLTVARGQS